MAVALVIGSPQLCAQDVPESRSGVRLILGPTERAVNNGDPTQWYPHALLELTGQLQTLDQDQVSIITAGQSVPERYAAARLVSAELLQVPDDQQRAIQSFRDGEMTKALTELVNVVSSPDPQSRPAVWRQQWLSMLASQAAMRSGRGEIALELVKQLDKRPLPMFVIALVPVDWTGVAGDNLFEPAAAMASSESLLVKLVAASWLIRSPKYRAAAEAALTRLAAQQDRPVVAKLAAHLAWRSKSPTETKDTFSRERSVVDQLPLALQTGPLLSLLDVARRTSQPDEVKELELALRYAAPTWHPDLPKNP
ncbi:hypothetical protein CGZ80_06750 [Rhodopirellula sp. MGV]|nr:hypothetical protein CGZ80_06750 [Rhodopirellula sp. MGV]PNY36193.1 hypothetical protein C2E31_13835 [Rhodopirellula baltica]